MQDCISRLHEAIRDFSNILDEFGRLGKRKFQKKAKVLEATLIMLLMYHFNRRLRHKRSLGGIMKDVHSLSEFRAIPEIDLILSILLFHFDKQLLIRSRNLISTWWSGRNFTKVIADINEQQPTRFTRRRRFQGVSVVIFFEYPGAFSKSMSWNLKPVDEYIVRTPSPHFTIANIGTKIPASKVGEVCRSVKNELERGLRADSDLSKLMKELSRNACIRDELRIMPDGSFVLFGGGEFLRAMHEVRVCLRETILLRHLESSLAHDAQPVWSHAVFARVVKKLPARQVRKVRRMILSNVKNVRIKLENPRMGLMIFKDKKAMLKPKEVDICVEL